MNDFFSATDTRQCKSDWTYVAQQYGTAFQNFELCRIFEETWPGRYYPHHILLYKEDKPVALAPAYLYESCPRVDYYKRSCQEHPISDPIFLSHALIGWYGFPCAANYADKRLVAQRFFTVARQFNAIAMFAGIDARDAASIQALQDEGFVLKHFHTLMIRDLTHAPVDDPTATQPARRRHRLRNLIARAERAGCTIRHATRADHDAIIHLLTGMMEQKRKNADALPSVFLAKLLESAPPGLEVLVAVDPQDTPIGVHLNLHWGSTYAMWLGANERSLLNQFYQSHLLYEYSVKRAKALGCNEVQAGRSPYQMKFHHGFEPTPLLCAVRGTSSTQHQRAADWAEALALRHHAIYPSVAYKKWEMQPIK